MEYMKDSEFIFNNRTMNETFGDGDMKIFIKVKTTSREATYTVKFVGREEDGRIQLNEHIYSFIPVVEQRIAHFNYRRWVIEKERKANVRFTVLALPVFGHAQLEFRACTSVLAMCTNPTKYLNYSQSVEASKHTEVSGKEVWDIEIGRDLIKQVNKVEEGANIIVVLKADGQMKYSLTAIEFRNNNKVLYMREGHPLEEKLMAQDLKVYKYVNSDPEVQEIRVHVN